RGTMNALRTIPGKALFRKQLRREVAFAEVGEDRYDQLAAVFGAAGELQGGPGGGATTDATHEAFELGEIPRGFHRVFILNADDFVDDVDVEHVGDEAGA